MNQPHLQPGAIFDAAIELPPEQRAAFLREACGGNEALCQRVEALLRAYESAGTFMDGLAVAPDRDAPGVKPADQLGDRIGRYKLLQQIGEGGCGVVYMAEQEEPVRRKVALKVIKLGMDTKSVIARFEAERQALALMDHPNIAKVFDAGATEAGRPYFVMELVKAIPITRYCDENNLSTVARLGLFVHVCQAIQHAHQKGIIHRDIKPSNVLVADHDGVPVPKIIDFGIAKATTDQRLTDKTMFTAFEQFIGTPAYMSPEQARLSGLDIDTRSDIYSLGVLLYELLTSKTPFEAKRLLNAGLDEIRRIIREEEPLRPSTRLDTLDATERTSVANHRQSEPPKLVHLIRGDLDWIVMKALEKDRARRYETANGLAMDIQRHLDREPVVARPASRAYRLRKLIQRNKLVWAAAAATATALLAGLAVSTWLLFREQALRQRAVASEHTALAEAVKSQQVARFLEEMLKGVGPSVALGLDTKLLWKILERTRERLGKDLTNQPAVVIELDTTLTEAYLELEAYRDAESMARETLARSRSHYGEDHPATGRALFDLGRSLCGLGVGNGLDFMRKGLAIQRKFLPADHLDLAKSLDAMAQLLRFDDQIPEAVNLSREALAMKRRLLGNDDPALCPTLNELGFLLMGDDARLPEAKSLFQESLRLHEKLTGGEDPDSAMSLRRLGQALAREGRLGQAEAMLRKALAIQRRLLGPEAPEVAWGMEYLGEVLCDEGKSAEGEALLRDALAMKRKLFGNDHSVVRWSLTHFGDVLRREGKLHEIETLFREAIILARAPSTNGLPREAPQFAVLLHHLADVLREQNKLTEARLFGQEAFTFYQRHPDWPTNERQHAFEVLVEVLSALGDLAGAEALCRDEVKAMRRQLSPGDTQLARTLAVATDIMLIQQRPTEAEPLARECLALEENHPPEGWRAFYSRSMLGGVLLCRREYGQAGPLLLAGYQGMKQRESTISEVGKLRLRRALQRLVELYEATGPAEKAAEWRRNLAEFEKSQTMRPAAAAQ